MVLLRRISCSRVYSNNSLYTELEIDGNYRNVYTASTKERSNVTVYASSIKII